jgi:hypothetical protein
MFPPLTIGRPKTRSLRELVRDAVDSALEFATLGEAPAVLRHAPQQTTAPTVPHPHRRPIPRQPRSRRPGQVRPRAQVCVVPVHRPERRR